MLKCEIKICCENWGYISHRHYSESRKYCQASIKHTRGGRVGWPGASDRSNVPSEALTGLYPPHTRVKGTLLAHPSPYLVDVP